VWHNAGVHDWITKHWVVASLISALSVVVVWLLRNGDKVFGFWNGLQRARIARIADNILDTVRPSRERGNVFTEEYIAGEIGETPKFTRKALFHLREQKLAYRGQDGSWMLGIGEDPAKRIWGRG
jgi:hypothetical protein